MDSDYAGLLFPCPLCGEGRVLQQTKKTKPYWVCNVCGVQVFVRNAEGIKILLELLEKAEGQKVWGRLERLEQRYRKKCAKCGKRFWISEELIQTSWLDGNFVGYRCPECGKL